MSADLLLSRLDRVRRTGQGRWICACPGHDDKHPSLSIRELDDGRILLHDFAGCEVGEVLGAIGLDFDALFPEKPIEGAKRERRPFLPADVFEIARFEIAVAALIAADLHKARTLSDADLARLLTAASRLEGIAGAAYGC